MKRPDFFIVGAFKSGTTALASYLRAHPDVFMPAIKETRFFAADFPDWRQVRTEGAYLALFEGADGRHRAVGEASPLYLYSECALDNIRRFDSEARIIIMVRNPVTMIHALHSQLLYTHDECEPSFERAWSLQEARAAGRCVPARSPGPEILQYAKVGRLGDQVERALTIFPQDQVHIAFFEDFVADPRSCYGEVLTFLSLSPDARATFPRVNPNKRNRLPWLAGLVSRPPNWLERFKDSLKAALGIGDLGLKSRIVRWQTRESERAPLSPEMRSRLEAAFRDDVGKLSRIVGRDLDHWTSGSE